MCCSTLVSTLGVSSLRGEQIRVRAHGILMDGWALFVARSWIQRFQLRLRRPGFFVSDGAGMG
jgi:hypothetical protein